MNATKLLFLLMMVMYLGCYKKQTESTELIESPGSTKPFEPTESVNQAVAEDNVVQIQPNISSGTDIDTRDEAV